MLHFIKLRKIWYILSILILIPGLISIATKGLHLGIDFTGGNILEISYEQSMPVEKVREKVADLGLEAGTGIQTSGESNYLLRTRHLTREENDGLIASLGELGKFTTLKNESVGPLIGEELTRKALLAIAIALVLKLLYIAIRFEFKQGVAAIIALIHDVLIVTGIFSLFQLEVDSAFVAAILTTIGYSINDTIIIFDRVRENLRSQSKDESLEDLVNRSLWQTLSRSINTALGAIFVLGALYFLGGSTIHTLVLALLIGVISGAYSSVCNAGPLWVDFKRLEKRGAAKAA